MDGVRGSSVGVNGFFHRSFIVLACFLTPLLPVIDGALDVAKGQQAEFHDGLAEIAAKHGLGRVWFRVEKNGRVLANVGLGGADPDQPIHVASLAKSITAIAVALLIQDGKLTLESKLSDLLGATFAQRGHRLDTTLQDITVEQLLSHTAGLRASSSVDPVNGLRSGAVLAALNENASVFDYIVTSGGDRSSGVGRYAYSNLSYAFLGLVIEAVSGESYGDFCRRRIFGPLGIRSATAIPGKYHAIESFGGWQISTADMIKIWIEVFNRANPSILSAATLDMTLFGKLGEEGYNSYYDLGAYTLGVHIRPSKDNSSYRLWHTGIDLGPPVNPTPTYTYIDMTVPGVAWIVASDSPGDGADQLTHEVRALVDNIAR
jgi:D-alanyl-D-alanine carboxypeptidase